MIYFPPQKTLTSEMERDVLLPFGARSSNLVTASPPSLARSTDDQGVSFYLDLTLWPKMSAEASITALKSRVDSKNFLPRGDSSPMVASALSSLYESNLSATTHDAASMSFGRRSTLKSSLLTSECPTAAPEEQWRDKDEQV